MDFTAIFAALSGIISLVQNLSPLFSPSQKLQQALTIAPVVLGEVAKITPTLSAAVQAFQPHVEPVLTAGVNAAHAVGVAAATTPVAA